MKRFPKFLQSPDILATLILFVLWALFFWRVFTPIAADQLSFTEGDFSGQFVAWTGYAAERLQDGELPLWNPYNYGGAPLQASPQTALTYPPRMLTLAFLAQQDTLTAPQVYAALQWEVMLHVLVGSLFIYVFMRRLVAENDEMTPLLAASGAVVAAVSFTYGGYAAGYPILQSPLIWSGIWAPLIWLAIAEATRQERPALGWRYILLGGAVLGISLLAGHPQTTWYVILMSVAWLAYRIAWRGWPWHNWLLATILLGLVAGGIAAVQLLPSAEFSLHSYRTEFSFSDKSGGYSFEELINLLFPERGNIWNASYFGVLPIILAGIALWRNVAHARFFGGLFLVAGLLSFGERLPLYGLLYPITPGLTFFRGQERITFILAHCAAILAGLGTAHLLTWGSWREKPHLKTLRRWLAGLALFTLVIVTAMYLLNQTDQRSPALLARMDGGAVSLMILAAIHLGLGWFLAAPAKIDRRGALLALLVFDLFSATFMLAQNYEPIPVEQRLPTPAIVSQIDLPPGGRVDSGAVWMPGYGTIYRTADIRGSDPLQIEGSHIYNAEIPLERAWELLAVGVAMGDWDTPPAPATPLGPRVWQLDEPRPFAHLAYQVRRVNTPEEAFGLLREPAYDPRSSVILEQNLPAIDNSRPAPSDGRAVVTEFAPEQVVIDVTVSQPAILSLSLWHYPGWSAILNGEKTDILRAYGGLSAVELPAGTHRVELRYQSRWLSVGKVLSIASTLIVLMIGGLYFLRGRS